MQQGQLLYVLQTELIDSKVEVSVQNNLADFRSEFREALSRLTEQISELRHEVRDLRTEMHKEIGNLRAEMHKEISSLGTRLTAVEAILGIRLERRADFRNRFMDFSFKVGWVAIGAGLTSFITFFGKSIHCG